MSKPKTIINLAQLNPENPFYTRMLDWESAEKYAMDYAKWERENSCPVDQHPMGLDHPWTAKEYGTWNWDISIGHPTITIEIGDRRRYHPEEAVTATDRPQTTATIQQLVRIVTAAPKMLALLKKLGNPDNVSCFHSAWEFDTHTKDADGNFISGTRIEDELQSLLKEIEA